MTDTPEILVTDMQAYYEDWNADTDVEFASKFDDRVKALGEQVFLVYLFRTFADARLLNWLSMLTFVWKDFSFAMWLRILEDLSDDRRFIYQFLWFANESLAMDVNRLDLSHQNVRAELRSETFRNGGPKPMSRELRAWMEDLFDYESVWRCLAREGAPMQALPSD